MVSDQWCWCAGPAAAPSGADRADVASAPSPLADHGRVCAPPTGPPRRSGRCAPPGPGGPSPLPPGSSSPRSTVQPARPDDPSARQTAPDHARDLTIRLRTPRPQVAVAHVGGMLEESTAHQLQKRISVLFGHVVHIVVDLTELTALTRGGVRALLLLHRSATSRGTQLHLVRPAAGVTGTGRQQLGRLASDRLIRLAPTTDAVLAEVLTAPRPGTPGPA